MQNQSHVPIFAALNFAFAALALAGILTVIAVLIFGIFLSGDPKDEIMDGVLGCIMLFVPLFLGFVIYLISGIGLIKRRTWGYYMHIVGAVLTIFSCVGMIYTIIALIIAFRPEFRTEFPGLAPEGQQDGQPNTIG